MTLPQNFVMYHKLYGNSDGEPAHYQQVLAELVTVDHFFPRSVYVDFGKFLSRRVSQLRASGTVPVVEAIKNEYQAYKQYKLIKQHSQSFLLDRENRNYFAHNTASEVQVLRATLDYDKTRWLARFKRCLSDYGDQLSESEFSEVKDILRNHFESVKHFFSELSGKIRGLATALSVTSDLTDKREIIRKKTKFIFTKTDDEDHNK